jgi:hypothetical protein
MPYTLGQAAKATGKSKSTLQVAIKKGRISATQDDLGQYQIDPAELHRVYPPHSLTDRQTEPKSEQDKTHPNAEKIAEITGLKARLEVMEQLVSELRGDKDKAERREADLRRDIDRWQALTFDAQQRLKALEVPKPEPMHEGRFIEAETREPTPKKGFFRRLFG